MTESPEPLTPPDCDLRGMEWMPLHGHKLYGSDFDAIANDAEYRAAQRLWWAAWQQQVPAASLPDDDRVLAHVAGYSRDPKGWAKIKAVALHAFVKCSDGRLYHRFLAPEAIVAWEKRMKERQRKADYRAKKDGTGTSQDKLVPRDTTGTEQSDDADVPILSHVDNTTQDKTGQDNLRKKEKERERGASAVPAPASPRKAASRIPDDWEPSEADADYARSLGLPVARVTAMFRDYWISKAGADARKHDWSATWRNWCRREDGALAEPQSTVSGSVARINPFPGWQTADHMALGQWEKAEASGSWFTQDAKRNLLSPDARRADLWAFIVGYRPLVAAFIRGRDEGELAA